MAFGKISLALGLVLWSMLVVAAEEEAPPLRILQGVMKLSPGIPPSRIVPSAIPGLYEVTLGPHVVYMSEDGRHVVRGDLIEIESGENLTEASRSTARLAQLSQLNEADMVVFAPEETKHTITVFTDVDCPYCAKLHRDVPKLTAQGVKVRYLAFPRAGISSGTYNKMVSVWCADDRVQAMTDAKARRPVVSKDCPNPVAEQYGLGRSLGIRGTPTIFLESGQMIPGYVPAERLVQMME